MSQFFKCSYYILYTTKFVICVNLIKQERLANRLKLSSTGIIAKLLPFSLIIQSFIMFVCSIITQSKPNQAPIEIRLKLIVLRTNCFYRLFKYDSMLSFNVTLQSLRSFASLSFCSLLLNDWKIETSCRRIICSFSFRRHYGTFLEYF